MEREIKEKLHRVDKKRLQQLIKSLGINVKASANRATLVDGVAQFVMAPRDTGKAGNAHFRLAPSHDHTSATTIAARRTGGKNNNNGKPSRLSTGKRRTSANTHQDGKAGKGNKTARQSISRSKRSRSSSASAYSTSGSVNRRQSPRLTGSRTSRSTSPTRKVACKEKDISHHRHHHSHTSSADICNDAVKAAIYEYVLQLPCEERKQLGAKSLRLYLEHHFALSSGDLKSFRTLIATSASNCVKALVEAEQAAMAAVATGEVNKVLYHTPFEPEGDSQSGLALGASPLPLAEQIVDELKEKEAYAVEEKATKQIKEQSQEKIGSSNNNNNNSSAALTTAAATASSSSIAKRSSSPSSRADSVKPEEHYLPKTVTTREGKRSSPSPSPSATAQETAHHHH
uniref:Uncharacterized protein n=1 Tax=Lygus hesperus TaxID=30085 RepID=A0A0A9Y3M6_LYGHE